MQWQWSSYEILSHKSHAFDVYPCRFHAIWDEVVFCLFSIRSTGARSASGTAQELPIFLPYIVSTHLHSPTTLTGVIWSYGRSHSFLLKTYLQQTSLPSPSGAMDAGLKELRCGQRIGNRVFYFVHSPLCCLLAADFMLYDVNSRSRLPHTAVSITQRASESVIEHISPL